MGINQNYLYIKNEGEGGKEMREKIKKYLSMLLVVVMISCGLQDMVFAEEQNKIVTTPEDFMEALRQHKTPITVDGTITVDNGADTDGRMRPVMFPTGTQIQGTKGSKLCFRSPIQLEGDGVSFSNIGLEFTSSNGTGSVPHREIFLAGYKLTLDNVTTYREGGDNPLLGTEKELLPTVYAGGYTGTQNGTNASLTVRNSNEKTMFQAIYLGHEAGNNNNSPYQGSAMLDLDAKVTVREKVDATLNSKAEISISGELNSYAKVKEIHGNENTTLTVNQTFMEKAIITNVENLILQEGACLSFQTAVLQNVTLKSGACLNLSAVGDVIISGDFVGVEGQEEERGILVLNQEGSVTIQGNVSGTTQFQTKDRLFPGMLTVGKSYIITNQGASSENNFVLAQASIDNGFGLNYSGGVWTADRGQAEIINIDRIEIFSAPEKVDLRKIKDPEDGTIANENVYFEVAWYNEKGEAFSSDVVEDYYFYDIDYVIPIKTEYWNSNDPEILEKTDWSQSVFLMPSKITPGRYCLQAQAEAQAGDYTFLFCSEYYEEMPITVADVKALSDKVLKEQRVIFYDQDPVDPEEPKDPEEHEHAYQEAVTKAASCTEKGIETYTCSCGDSYTKEIPALGHKEVIDAAVKPTETTEGKTQGSHCSVCGTILKKQETIPATGVKDPEEHKHAYQEAVTKAASCTEKGIETYTCSCGDSYTKEIPALGHKEVIDAAVKPTETTEGKTQGSHCSVCGTILKKQETIPATGVKDPEEHKHAYQGKVTKAANCTQKGVKTYTCSCGDSYTKEIPVLGHKYKEKRIAATIKKNGSVRQVCSICSKSRNVATIYRVKKITLSKVDYIWNNKGKKPSIMIKDSKGKKLKENSDYKVSYAKGRKHPGIYTITITFRGNYSGKVTKTFTIRPKGCSLGKVTAKCKGFQVTWKKQTSQTSGYQLQYCTAKNFKGKTAKTVDIKKNSTVKKNISKLKAKKKYYIRIRTYKIVKVNGKNKELYSDWSKAKTVRTK